MADETPAVLWRPDEQSKKASRLQDYIDWLEKRYALHFTDYPALWEWSVQEPRKFWESLWQYFDIISHSPYTEVLSEDPMPHSRWFSGSRLNYAEHVFRQRSSDRPAILFKSEAHDLEGIEWTDLEAAVASVRQYLLQNGVQKGDRVVAYMPNIPETTVAFLACCSLGAVWSSCSPDFGVSSVTDRFAQIEPKVLFAVDGYQYNGKPFDKQSELNQLIGELPSLEKVVFVPYLDIEADHRRIAKAKAWEEVLATPAEGLPFEAVPFDHPLWILYSSGTTGKPKAITHAHGGILLEHLKYLAFHNDLQEGERFFWFTTTGWMMWNFLQSSLLLGGTMVLYDGAPGYPSLHTLWAFCRDAGIHHFGAGAPFLVAGMKRALEPGRRFDLKFLRSVGSTGAPLPSEAFDWVYEALKEDVWLCSMSGGTDVCSAFVGGCLLLPVYRGEIQCRALGCALYAFNEKGEAVTDEVGEMVITKPMPSMPIYFWNDPDKQRYRDSYFDMFPGIWRHGDWVKVTSRHSLIIYGRSDATLNRQGIRIGTSEIYRAMHLLPEVEDSIIVNLELPQGEHYMPLFVVLKKGVELTPELKKKINTQLRETYSPRHIPDDIIEIAEVPYTISGKKLEAPVKKVLLGQELETVASKDSMRNPKAMDFFLEFRKQLTNR